ncbi:SpoIIE family protein phosphatase [Caproicibacter fermentans]|uniref:SpoIIE family protein phosphatase n=1 Tax=Caproicibacter fermentans TaxID=2576756 RepID=A0A7G8T965_9FIRM|nr:SpoIIE family protein phosphatase [Caproicibacter fermentans]QNK40156.1 SpoIIE family protein phosphatase [Caproicibacter fermentans]
MAKENIRRIRLSAAAAAPARTAARHLAAFTAGMLFARGTVFGQYAPFGVAAAAAMPYSVLWSAILGSAAGYLLPSAVTVPVHYLAALLAAAAIRWTLNDLVRLRSHPVFAPVVAFLPVLATGMSVALVNGSGTATTAMYVAEAMLAGAAAYFFRRTVSVWESGRSPGEWSAQETTCAAFSAGLLILSLSGLSAGGVSAGRVLAVLAILFAARYGGVSGGSVSGVAAGIAFSLSTAGLNYLSGAYALGGLMAGLFSPVGRLASACAFVAANTIASLQVGNQAAVVSGLYEVMAATVIYMLLPAKTGSGLVGIFSRSDDSSRAEGLRRSVIMKLDFAAKALGSVSESVEEVSKKLQVVCSPDISSVYHKAADEVCRTCGLNAYCWDRNFTDSMNAFNDLSGKLKEKGQIQREDFSQPFASHCGRLNLIADAVNRNYGEYVVRAAAEGRAQQVRDVVAVQFETTSSMLEEMASELELYDLFDYAAAQKVEETLRIAGIQPFDVSCRTDRFGRMSVEIVSGPVDCARLSKAELTEEISRACSRTFQPPCVTTAGGKCRIQMTEMPVFRIKSGCAQHVCGNGKLCGDSWEMFSDGNGRQIAVLSDGMGTGGRAAVDGAMACGIMTRLIKAGIGFDAALKIVNSALLVKSGDESLATMDIAAVDLFNGRAELFKAGAPSAILRRNGHAAVIDTPSLPIGILNETRFAKSSETLADGDLLILMTDGALSSGAEWICEEAEKWNGRLPQELAEAIVSRAISNRRDGHDDDITVVVQMLTKLE